MGRVDWPAPLAAACLLIAGAYRSAVEGFPSGGALIALGAALIGWWMHHHSHGGDK